MASAVRVVIVLLAAALVSRTAAAAPPRVWIEPAAIDLGPGGTSKAPVVHVEGAARAPRLLTNVGSVGQPTAAGPGRWRAELVPPEQHFPQVAVVLVVAEEGEEVAYLPMRGRAELPVETDPLAQVEVLIEGQRFGPVQADGRGRARVPITVAPGQKRALVTSTRAGKSTEHELDIPLPPYPRIITSLPAALPAGATFSVAIAGVGSDDRPVPAAALVLSVASRAVALHGRGHVGVATMTVPTRAGEELAIAFGTREALARVDARVAPAAPARLDIRGLPGKLRVGTGEALAVEVDAFDAWGNVAAERIAFESELVAEPELDAPGRWRGRLRALDRAPRAHAPSVTVRAGSASAEGSVTLVGGPPARIEIAPLDRPLVADGDDSGELALSVYDRWGLPTSLARPAVQIGGAPATSGSWREEGVFALAVTMPDGASALAIDANAGSARASAVFDAAHPLGTLALELGAGVHSNLGAWLSPVIAAHAGVRLLRLEEWGFGIGGYSWLLVGAIGEGDGSASLRVIPLVGGAFVQRRFGEGWLLEASGGVGAAFSHVVVEEGGGERASDATDFTGLGVVAVGRGLGPGWVVLGIRGHALGLDAETGVDGRLGGLGATLGYRYGLF